MPTLTALRARVALQPRSAEAHHALAAVLARHHEYDEALTHVAIAAQLDPRHPGYAFDRGVFLMSRDLWQEAMTHEAALEAAESLATAIRLDPAALRAHLRLGRVQCLHLGEADAARETWTRALQLDPERLEAYVGLGHCAIQGRTLEEALAAIRSGSAAQRPDLAIAGLATALLEHGRALEALASLDYGGRGLEDTSELLACRGQAVLSALGDVEASLECYRRAVTLNPRSRTSQQGLMETLLIAGRFAEGRQQFRACYDAASQQTSYDRPVWNGEPLRGKSILVHFETGLGDAVQWVRLPGFLENTTVVCQSHRSVQPLLATARNVTAIRHEDDPPPVDYECDENAFPALTDVALERLGSTVPYLGPPPRRYAWLDGVWPERRLRVGIAWRGRQHWRRNAYCYRSVPLELLAALAGGDGCAFYSLQKDGDAEAASAAPWLCLDPARALVDLGDLAALVQAMDLVITIDTAVAHVAAALGRPTWILLPFLPHWRWLLQRSDSPFYPTARLFRQTSPGVWREPIDAIVRALRDECQRHRTNHHHAGDASPAGVGQV